MQLFQDFTPYRTRRFFGLVAVFLLAFSFSGRSQVTVAGNQTATALAQKLVGTGVTISNVTLSCPTNANGIFAGVSNLGIDSGIVLTSGTAATSGTSIGVNGAQNTPATSNSGAGDPDLNTLSGQNTFDACKLEFDFIPSGDTVKFDYVFGSAEYFGYSCSSFNDVFGFFISGPGIVGQKNIALVPGTTIPVAVNSTTNPTLTTPGSIGLCTAMGPGSPFGQYFINNTNGTTITYRGFTSVFRAITPVVPCTTYHLKLAIADAVDYTLDSGVFLKAGSLTSEALQITPVGGGGLTIPAPYTVRGCLPGQIKFRRPTVRTTPLTIFYQIAGTAVNGVDYVQIPDSVVIPANDSIGFVNIAGIPAATPQPPKLVKLIIYAPGCGSSTGVVVDSTFLEIRDSFQAAILTPDTVICRGQDVKIRVSGDQLLSFSWSPATALSATNIRNPTATPLATTLYTATVSLPGSGCASIQRKLLVTVRQPPIINAGPDTATCVGAPYTFPTTVNTAVPTNQSYSFTWTPAAGLSSATVQNPSVTPAVAGVTTTYIVTANPGAQGCARSDTVNVRSLPNSITLYNKDTAICTGAAVQIKLDGDTVFNYQWYPITAVSNTTIRQPLIQPTIPTTYTVTATFPGCPAIVRQIAIDVQPNPVVNIGLDREKCQWDTLQLRPIVDPSTYPAYTYSWTPATAVEDPTAKNTLFINQASTNLTLTVKTPAGCIGSDEAHYTVHQGNFATLNGPADTGICPRTVINYAATGGATYQWSPSLYLSATNMPTVSSQPITDVTYTLLVTDTNGCYDTLYSALNVYPSATFNLPDSVVLYPGDSIQFQTGGNISFASWFPPQGLSSSTVSNPVARPTVDTRYFVTGTTESGCQMTDSVDVFVRTESLLALPNAFVPGSGPNGVFKIVKEGLATLRYFRIFNRWGTKVFETTNLETGWDGTYNGEPQPMGVYIYDVDAVTNTGRRFTQQGNITLIR